MHLWLTNVADMSVPSQIEIDAPVIGAEDCAADCQPKTDDSQFNHLRDSPDQKKGQAIIIIHFSKK